MCIDGWLWWAHEWLMWLCECANEILLRIKPHQIDRLLAEYLRYWFVCLFFLILNWWMGQGNVGWQSEKHKVHTQRWAIASQMSYKMLFILCALGVFVVVVAVDIINLLKEIKSTFISYAGAPSFFSFIFYYLFFTPIILLLFTWVLSMLDSNEFVSLCILRLLFVVRITPISVSISRIRSIRCAGLGEISTKMTFILLFSAQFCCVLLVRFYFIIS